MPLYEIGKLEIVSTVDITCSNASRCHLVHAAGLWERAIEQYVQYYQGGDIPDDQLSLTATSHCMPNCEQKNKPDSEGEPTSMVLFEYVDPNYSRGD